MKRLHDEVDLEAVDELVKTWGASRFIAPAIVAVLAFVQVDVPGFRIRFLIRNFCEPFA